MTDKTVEHVILALQVIGSIREKDRIYTMNGSIVVSPPFKSDCIYRWWNKESREKNLEDVDNTLETSFTLIDGLMATEEVFYSHNGESVSRRRAMEVTKNQQALTRISAGLETAKAGLCNLQITYNADVTTSRRIGLLINKIEDKQLQLQRSREYYRQPTPAVDCKSHNGSCPEAAPTIHNGMFISPRSDPGDRLCTTCVRSRSHQRCCTARDGSHQRCCTARDGSHQRCCTKCQRSLPEHSPSNVTPTQSADVSVISDENQEDEDDDDEEIAY